MNPPKTDKRLQNFAWVLVLAVMTLAIVVWGQNLSWQLTKLSTYQIFPLLGLLAFSIMWTHYIIGALRRLIGVDFSGVKRYFQMSSWLALLFFCMHPGLLTWQLWRDGFRLPPGSVLHNYVAPGLGWVAVLGMVSFLLFLSFELHRWLGKSKWWWIVTTLVDFAMVAIFYHALRLGSQTQTGWFHVVWLFYGATLIISLIYIYSQKLLTMNAKAKVT